jgi:hypothetical protein
MKKAHKLCLFVVGAWTLGMVSSPRASGAQPADAISQIETLGGTVRWLANGSNIIEVDFQFSGTAFKDEHLPVLASLQNLTMLRLKNTAITDAGLSHVAKVTTLKRLDLSGTAVTDAGLKHLADLKKMETLNLFETTISDAGLLTIQEFPSLKQLFVWQTKVSAAGIAQLQKAKPGLRVVPDPAADREHARIILDTALAALTRAQETVEPTKQQAAQVNAEAELKKKEFEESQKRAEKSSEGSALRKQADAQKQVSEEAEKKAAKSKDAVATAEQAVISARQQVEEARRDLAKLFDQSKSTTNAVVKP